MDGDLDTASWICRLSREVEEEVHGLLVGSCGDAGTLNANAEVEEDALLGWCCELLAELSI